MLPQTARVERRGPVTILTIDRPAVRNCIDAATADGIASAIEAFGRDDDARVLVVAGAGTEAFWAGADLRDIEGLMLRPQGERTAPLRFSWLDPGKPTIAAIEGYCVGGGMELACWCDLRFPGEGAVFEALNRRVGVPWVDGGTQRLPRIVGQGNPLYLLETGERIGAPSCVRDGARPGGGSDRGGAAASGGAGRADGRLPAGEPDRRSPGHAGHLGTSGRGRPGPGGGGGADRGGGTRDARGRQEVPGTRVIGERRLATILHP